MMYKMFLKIMVKYSYVPYTRRKKKKKSGPKHSVSGGNGCNQRLHTLCVDVGCSIVAAAMTALAATIMAVIAAIPVGCFRQNVNFILCKILYCHLGSQDCISVQGYHGHVPTHVLVP